jgi:hypothetical protein
MTLPDWNSKDYEVDFPDIVIAENTPIVDVPLPGKLGFITKYLLGNILPDAQKATMNGFDLAGLFVALAAIDYLAGYFVGRETTGNDYKNFMRRYFPEKYLPYLDAIYKQIRCGLMHNLVPLDPWRGNNQIDLLIQGQSLLHLVELAGKISFSIPIFIEDTRRALVIYRYELIMHPNENQELIANFEKRFKRLSGKASVMIKIPDQFM